MKKIRYWIAALVIPAIMASCSNEVVEPQQKGNPTLQVESQFTNVHFVTYCRLR